MEADFWLERWECGQTGWDLTAPHDDLTAHWHLVGARVGSDVFVPLCGASVDMVWLAGVGHTVIGNELSDAAVSEFFGRRGLDPEVSRVGHHTVHRAGRYELWCGDFFELTSGPLASVSAVYDRASLVALPPSMRRGYAAHLTSILPDAAVVFLVSFEYDEAEMSGPPFSVTAEEIDDLYGDAFEIDPIVDTHALDRNPDLAARGLRSLRETVTILRRRS